MTITPKRGRPRLHADGEVSSLHLYIPVELHKRLRIMAVTTDTQMREIVIKAIEGAVAKYEKGARK